jgi:hypothetical protein
LDAAGGQVLDDGVSTVEAVSKVEPARARVPADASSTSAMSSAIGVPLHAMFDASVTAIIVFKVFMSALVRHALQGRKLAIRRKGI